MSNNLSDEKRAGAILSHFSADPLNKALATELVTLTTRIAVREYATMQKQHATDSDLQNTLTALSQAIAMRGELQ
jgi:hypothetical protein